MSRLFAIAFFAATLSSSVFAMDKAYFEINKVIIKDVTSQYQQIQGPGASLGEICSGQSPMGSRHSMSANTNINPMDQIGVYVDQIINIGKKIWSVVEGGKASVNVKFDTANALPRGINCWTDMAGWSIPQSKVYSIQYVNNIGLSVVDFTYRVVFTPNGNLNGVGQYITNAGFIPAEVSVAWGFKFNATASVPSVFNRGSKESPIAGMQLNINWIMDSIVNHEEATRSYFVSGDNNFVEIN